MSNSSENEEYDWRKLRIQLTERLSLTELHLFCFDLGLDFEDIIGKNLSEKVVGLLEILRRAGRLSELIDLCKQERPNFSWEYGKTQDISEDNQAISNLSLTEIARILKAIETQSKFFDEITEAIFKWRQLTIEFSYYGGQLDFEPYQIAKKTFIENRNLIILIRNEISKSQRFVSENTYQGLLDLYQKMIEVDNHMEKILKIEFNDPAFRSNQANLNRYVFHSLTPVLDSNISKLANDLQLKFNASDYNSPIAPSYSDEGETTK